MKNRYFVYEHIRPDTGEVFYVGKGMKDRAHTFKGRNNKWLAVRKILLDAGLDVEVQIVADNLPNESAHCIEKMRMAYHEALGIALTNVCPGSKAPVPSVDRIRSSKGDHAAVDFLRQRAKLRAVSSVLRSRLRRGEFASAG